MRFAHLSDLHLGKVVHECSMLEDQKEILERILQFVDETNTDAVLVSGDVFDRAVPSTEAIFLWEHFLDELVRMRRNVYVISGNHDSAQRLAFGSKMIGRSGVYVARPFGENYMSMQEADAKNSPSLLEEHILEDEYGRIRIFMLPYVKPSMIRPFFPEMELQSWTDALRAVIGKCEFDSSERTLLLAHQFVTGAVLSDSEDLMVGGAEQIDADIFEAYDYVALGHLHRPQYVRRETIRYCGSPLKYSFSECGRDKVFTVVEMGAKEDGVKIEEYPLLPKRDLRILRGSYEELTARDFYDGMNTEDYIKVILTDEEETPEVIRKLRTIYPNILAVEYERSHRYRGGNMQVADVERCSPVELFARLFQEQNGKVLSEEQRTVIRKLVEELF